MSDDSKTISVSYVNAIAGLIVSIIFIIVSNWSVTAFYVDMNILTLKDGFERVVKSVEKNTIAQETIKDKNSARDQETLRIKLEVKSNTRRIESLESNPR